MRKDGRQENELRPITMIRDFTDTKGGSVLISWGNTRVLCTALLEEGTMPFLKGTGKGWLTAEYEAGRPVHGDPAAHRPEP